VARRPFRLAHPTSAVTAARARLRLTLFAIAATTLTAAALVAYATDALRDTELDSVDARFEARGKQEPPKGIAVVTIDDVTFSELRHRWPFPRGDHARVIDHLNGAGAEAIAYDVQFTEPSDDFEQDNELIRAVDGAENVVLATTEVDEHGGTAIFGGDDVLRDIGARAGNGLFPNDPGGVIRRMSYDIDGLKTLGVVAAEIGFHRDITPSEMGGKTAYIDFAGPPGTIPSIPFSRVYKGDFPRDAFRGKVVVVGPSAPSLQDVHPTSTASQDLMSGAEIQANAMATALRGFPLQPAPGWLNVALIVLFGLAGPVAAVRLRPVAAVAAVGAIALLYAVAAQLAFNSGLILSFVYPIASLALGLVGALAISVVIGAFERQRVREIFARFVPEPVVDDVLARTDADVRLGGERRDVTVVFTDVRGFTTYSETREPDEVLEVLNRYLTTMTDVILKHGGTLISYMGDGIMAVFGAPIEQKDHAERALAAAREMVDTGLQDFNDWMSERGAGAGFHMGVGLNSGYVMAGNVGSEQRLEYTAIGDVTNTASRLESMTKDTPYSIFVSDSTRRALDDVPDDLVYVDELPVRGKSATVAVWSVPEGMLGRVPGVVTGEAAPSRQAHASGADVAGT
jgi:adenylate cyclase